MWTYTAREMRSRLKLMPSPVLRAQTAVAVAALLLLCGCSSVSQASPSATTEATSPQNLTSEQEPEETEAAADDPATGPTDDEIRAALKTPYESWEAGYFDGYADGNPYMERGTYPYPWDVSATTVYDEGYEVGLADGTAEKSYGESGTSKYSDAWFDHEYGLGDAGYAFGCAMMGRTDC